MDLYQNLYCAALRALVAVVVPKTSRRREVLNRGCVFKEMRTRIVHLEISMK